MTEIVIDLPPPISVNAHRKFDWTASKQLSRWKRSADVLVLMAKCRADNPLKLTRIKRFEIWIVLDEKLCDLDADNSSKHLIDYLRKIDVIEDDSKRHMRGVHIVWGDAPEGCRVIVKPLEA